MYCVSKYQTVPEWNAGSDINLYLLPNPDLCPNVNGEEIKLDGGTSLDTSARNLDVTRQVRVNLWGGTKHIAVKPHINYSSCSQLIQS